MSLAAFRYPSLRASSVILLLSSLGLLAAVTAPGCSSDDDPKATGAVGGPVKGDEDKHCIDASGAAVKQVVHASACEGTAGTAGTAGSAGTSGAGGAAGTSGSAGTGGDAGTGGTSSAGAAGTSAAHEGHDDDGDDDDYGDTLFNSSGADDDCKYDLSFTSTAIQQNVDVAFTVTIKGRADDAAVVGAATNVEVFLDETHPAPNSNTSSAEASGGVYTIRPVRFDKAGRWTVRFHIFEECVDLTEDSPHGHAAFYIDVP